MALTVGSPTLNMTDRGYRSDVLEREPHRSDGDATFAAGGGHFGQACPIERLDGDDQFGDLVRREKLGQVVDRPEDRHAVDVQPPFRRVIVDEADREEQERSILEQGVNEEASPAAGPVDQDRGARRRDACAGTNRAT